MQKFSCTKCAHCFVAIQAKNGLTSWKQRLTQADNCLRGWVDFSARRIKRGSGTRSNSSLKVFDCLFQELSKVFCVTEIDKLAWLYIRNKQLLFARSKGKTIFYIPGGKREPGESDAAALIREIREELSVDLLPEALVHACSFSAQADGKPEGVMVRNTCYFAECGGEPMASTEIEELAWFNYGDRERCSPVAKLILDWLHSTGRIE